MAARSRTTTFRGSRHCTWCCAYEAACRPDRAVPQGRVRITPPLAPARAVGCGPGRTHARCARSTLPSAPARRKSRHPFLQ
ncbi:hypothetical protein M885DRAFT_514785 [Pelagophyceae sp. CCMP2097]|nr:hypothetical protein M885DRAFT_514785 [Pelagophyceae sp. CCMP2097]